MAGDARERKQRFAVRQRLGIRLLALLASGLFISLAVADELRPALLELSEISEDVFDVVWKTEAIDGATLGITPTLPINCDTVGDTQDYLNRGASVVWWRINCPTGLNGETISIPGLNSISVDVLVRIERLDGSLQIERLSALSTSFAVKSSPGFAGVANTYFAYGVTHILAGYDHLLFVLALVLLIANGRKVLIAVTAFTVAHSITLAVATLGVFRPAQAPIEAVIALSILFLAVELVRKRQGHDSITLRRPWLVAFAFGLLHGFGFASALLEAGLPQQDIPAALLFFNLGVEAGQLAFIGSVLLLGRILRSTSLFDHAWIRLAPHYAIGVMAAFWTIQRVAAFWP